MKGRGTGSNPTGRFEKLSFVPDPEFDLGQGDRPPTEFFSDTTRGLLSYNQSPDVGFDASINPYRGCEHGCVYCYARPTHEYLGLSAGLDFETRIMVKQRAPELLREELLSPGWKPQVIALSGVTDPYQPIERRLELTRRCLEVLLEFRNPVAVITKNQLVARDVDLFREMAQFQGISVNLSITTLDSRLQRRLEPRASSPARRLEAIRHLSQNGIPVRVLIAPVIPSLNDHEIPAILAAAERVGARQAGYILLRLPYGVRDLMQEWLTEHYPDRKKKVLNQLSQMREGRLNDPEFFSRMKGTGTFAGQIRQLFEVARRKAGLDGELPRLADLHFRRPGEQHQLPLW